MRLKDNPDESRKTVSFVEKLAGSEAFTALFREGMSLVEDAAAYLDGAGREEAKALPKTEALAYAAESMRLTTRLMQIASWLLLQRAVNHGEMTRSQAASDRHRVKLSQQELASSPEIFDQLPPKSIARSVEHSLRLQAASCISTGDLSARRKKPQRPRPGRRTAARIAARIACAPASPSPSKRVPSREMSRNRKSPGIKPGFLLRDLRDLISCCRSHVAKARVEARQASAAVEQLRRTAGPGRMGLRIDVEVHDVALLALGRAGEILRPIGHDHFDHVVVRMYVLFHLLRSLGLLFTRNADAPAIGAGASGFQNSS